MKMLRRNGRDMVGPPGWSRQPVWSRTCRFAWQELPAGTTVNRQLPWQDLPAGITVNRQAPLAGSASRYNLMTMTES